jgi:16S rRNA (cytidine1402-2'-O)-methyltransferase
VGRDHPHPARHGQDGDVPLLIAATPIGNAADASKRLLEALGTADVVAAEDTRRVQRLASTLGVRIMGRVVSYYDAVERARTPALLEELRAGRTVLLVSDAGTPLVSDPGHRLVAAAAAEDLPVSVLPGPSAALAALAVAGLPADRWCFEGFLPRRAADRRRRLVALAQEQRTMVFFEAPHRAHAALADLATAFGPDRPAVACRELTKTHEEVRRGSLGQLTEWAVAGLRGELTIVVAGATLTKREPETGELAAAVAALVATGMTTRDAVDAVAAEHEISRRLVYNATTTL